MNRLISVFRILFLSLGLLYCAACSQTDDPSADANHLPPNDGIGDSGVWAPPSELTELPLILVGMDGFKPEYIEKARTPNLDMLVQEGVLADGLIPVFPSKTFPNMYSIVTGLYPENTGIISNNMYDAEMDAEFQMTNRASILDSRWWGGEPIWVTAEKQGVKTGTLFWVGSEVEIKGTRPTYWVTYNGSWSYTERVDRALNWLMVEPHSQRPSLLTLYFSNTDRAGHQHGPHSQETIDAIEWIDTIIGYLITKLKQIELWPNVNLMLVSDHGMVEQSEDKVIFLDNFINLSEARIIEWSPVAMIQPHEGMREKLYDQLKRGEATNGNFKVYYKEDLPEYYRLKNHPRVPDILVIADMPYAITSRYFFQQNGLLAGNHGYDHREPEMHGFFLAHGPAFASGKRVEAFELVHLYEVMSLLLGVKPSANDGNLSQVGPLLFGP